MTRRDTWANGKVRPAVAKWRAFRDEAQRLGITVLDGDSITFVVAMPASWSARKRSSHNGEPHRSKPDLDNLVGGLFDAAHPNGDQQISELGAVRKVWGSVGEIVIDRRERPTQP